MTKIKTELKLKKHSDLLSKAKDSPIKLTKNEIETLINLASHIRGKEIAFKEKRQKIKAIIFKALSAKKLMEAQQK